MKSVKSEKPSQASRYFLEIKINCITTTQTYQTPIKISLFKGMQKLDEVKNPIEIKDREAGLDETNTSLNFYTTNDNSKRVSQYRILVETLDNNLIGEASINISPLIEEFVKRGKAQHTIRLSIGDTMEISMVAFVEKTKQDLTKSVHSYSETSSMLKYKTQPNKSATKSTGTSKLSSNHKNSKTREALSHDEVLSEDLSQAGGFKLVSEEKSQQGEPKVLYEKPQNENIQQSPQQEQMIQQDDFDSISVIEDRKSAPIPTKVWLTSSLIFLGLLCYFIITIEDQKYELAKLSKIAYRTITNTL